MLIFIGPFMDQAVSKKWILDYDYNVPAMGYLFFSCAVAVLVNISQFMCLGRFSAVTFQVGAAAALRVLWCHAARTRTAAMPFKCTCMSARDALAHAHVGQDDTRCQLRGLVQGSCC